MTEIRELKPTEWPMLTGVFDKVFKGAEMPSPDHAKIIGAFEDGKIQAFIVLENAVFIWECYSREKNGNVLRKLIRYVRDKTPAKQAVGAGADEPRLQMLFKTLGLEEMPGKLFWRSSK
jgi:hypothetical protein